MSSPKLAYGLAEGTCQEPQAFLSSKEKGPHWEDYQLCEKTFIYRRWEMISKPCPICKGTKAEPRWPSVLFPMIPNPCPICKDPTGQPTGRICILSTEELEQLDWELVGQKDPRTETIWSDVVEEMTLRKTGEGK